MSNNGFDVNIRQGQVRFFDNIFMIEKRFQEYQFRLIDADLYIIKGHLHVRSAIDGVMMDANRGQGQVTVINRYVID